jgi:SAM-dependent methyltransferase
VAGPLAGPAGSPADHEAVLRDLVEAAMARAGPAGTRLQLKQAGRTLDGVVPGLRGAPWRTTYVKPLPADPGQLRFGKSRNHARITWAVRKAEREGLCVRDAASEGDLRDWYRLYLDVNRWRGLPSRPYRLFQAAWQSLRPDGYLRLLLVHQRRPGRERLLAGSMLLMLGETVFYAFNGRRRDALPLRPNDLLQWHAMRDAAADGYRWYDFGEVSDGNEGLARFKAKWDTQPRTLVRYHSPPLEHPQIGYAEPGGQAWPRVAAMAAWRRVPLPVTALAGDLVYRFL